MHYHWGQTAAKKKKKRGHFGWLERQWAVYIASYESCQPNRDLFSVGTKLKESIFKDNSQINSTVTTRTCVLSTDWIRM